MTLQPRIAQSPAQRKKDARRYSQHAVYWAAGSIAIGLALGVVLSWWLCALAIVVGGAMTLVNVNKVRTLINHKDEWS